VNSRRRFDNPGYSGAHRRALPPNPARTGRARADIEGLRAFAVVVVVVYHSARRLFPGGFIGVDVFFVISGFLITGLILRELDTTGRLSLKRFWSRRAKRLLPATAMVLGFSAWVTWALLPTTQRRIFGWDIVDAAAYIVNWRLGARSVDYLAEGLATSPVEHFWSLAVEEQFYIIWPVLIVAASWVSSRINLGRRAVLGTALVVVSGVSIWSSVTLTAANSELAFFGNHTRIWELGIGALIAFGAARLTTIPVAVARLLGWAGLAAIVASVWIFTTNSTWPGLGPALPCLGAAAVIVAGLRPVPGGVGLLLSAGPLVWIGGLSYSIYLWHGPFLVGATAWWGEIGSVGNALVAAASLIPAYLAHKVVENPIRFSPTLARLPGLALSVGLNCTAVGVVLGLVVGLSQPWGQAERQTGIQAEVDAGSGEPTAEPARPSEALGARMVNERGANWETLVNLDKYDFIVPDPALATQDLPVSYSLECIDKLVDPPVYCMVGQRDAPIRVAAVGDSMMQQWEPALDLIGKERGIRFELYIFSTCSFASALQVRRGELHTGCLEWGRNVMKHLLADPPDLVLTSQLPTKALSQPQDPIESENEAALIAGMQDYWAKLAEANIPVAVVAKNPGTVLTIEPPYECVEQNREALTRCLAADTRETAEVQIRAIETSPVPVHLIDLNNFICGLGKCPIVIGNVLVYRQGFHMTRTFVETLAPRFDLRLAEVLGLER
jgi:peptidoglycan/LPS O-acetylase OafA/YrhL